MKLLIVSDIHANWVALQAILAAEPDCENVLCLGDLVDYGPQPVECLAWAAADGLVLETLPWGEGRGVL